MAWTVYMIENEKGMLYTGITTDLERRLEEHQNSPKGASFFRFAKALKVVYQESYPDRSSASKRESQIKKMTRQQKLDLAAPMN